MEHTSITNKIQNSTATKKNHMDKERTEGNRSNSTSKR